MKKNKLLIPRKSYNLNTLDIQDILPDPVKMFSLLFDKALTENIPEPNAMILSTADIMGNMSSRVVLLKEFNEKGFVFFTNYHSLKGKQIKENPKAAILFFWPQLQQQIRIEGKVSKTSQKESDEYFNSRPFESRIGALISIQSSPIPDRESLDKLFKQKSSEYKNYSIKRPANWGGYIVKPTLYEFWQGRENRLHDRFRYTLVKKSWFIERLAP